MTSWLLDTGPLVSYLNRRDPDHHRVAEKLEPFRGGLVTSAAVVTETMYFLARHLDGPTLVAQFLASSRTRVYGLGRPAQVGAAAELMGRYNNLPMDYADATLLLLADQLELTDVLTLDARGFAAYRTPNGTSLRQVLQLS